MICLKGGGWGLALVSRSYSMCIGSGSILNVRGTKVYDNPNSAAYAHAGEGRGLGRICNYDADLFSR